MRDGEKQKRFLPAHILGDKAKREPRMAPALSRPQSFCWKVPFAAWLWELVSRKTLEGLAVWPFSLGLSSSVVKA
jgi:hypothetical protein